MDLSKEEDLQGDGASAVTNYDYWRRGHRYLGQLAQGRGEPCVCSCQPLRNAEILLSTSLTNSAKWSLR